MTFDEKYKKLKENIKKLGSVAIAFSGGVDSTLLAKVCKDVLGHKAIAITVFAPMHSSREIQEALVFGKKIGIKHNVIKFSEIDIDGFKENPMDRCYICKKKIFSDIKKEAEKYGIKYVVDGSNMDDLQDYRPGLKAIEELEVISPLKEAGLTKEDIRYLSKKLELPTWNKPAFACLVSRIPYGEEITKKKLNMIEKSEDYLREIGFRQYRVRCHGDISRIEVAPEERTKFFHIGVLDGINNKFKELGFSYVSMDLEGYKMGKMNKDS